MTLDAADLLADSSSAPSRDALTEVSQLAARQIELEDAIAATEEQLKALNAELVRVRDHELPLALSEHGLSEIAMADGSRVRVQDVVRASIPKDRREEAYAWLAAQGHGDLIKHEVSASFGRGEDDQAAAAIEALRTLGLGPEDKRSVHPGTLSAFVREQIEAGNPLPNDLLGVFIGRQTRITRAK